MKNTNFCAKANMKRDVNKVEPARRVLLKQEPFCLPSWCFSVLHAESAAAATRFTNLPQSAAPQTSEPVPQQGGSLKLPMPAQPE